MVAQMEQEPSFLLGRFPFAMVMIGTFLFGSIFLALNGPLIALLLSDCRYSSIQTLIEYGVAGFWKKALEQNGVVLPVAIFLLAGFIAGHLLRTLDRFLLIVLSKFVNVFLLPKCPSLTKLIIFSPMDFSDNLLAQIVRDPASKAHWEWTYFNYDLRWHTFLCVLSCMILVNWLTWAGAGVVARTVYVCAAGLIILIYLLHSMMYGVIMARANDYYRKMYPGV